MHEKSEGFKPYHPIKEVPRMHGEKWKLWDGRIVTIIDRRKGGAYEVINPKGLTEIVYGLEFKRREGPVSTSDGNGV